jgi:hypothetical protein
VLLPWLLRQNNLTVRGDAEFLPVHAFKWVRRSATLDLDDCNAGICPLGYAGKLPAYPVQCLNSVFILAIAQIRPADQQIRQQGQSHPVAYEHSI